MAERLRRLTRNQLGSSRAGSNPALRESFFCLAALPRDRQCEGDLAEPAAWPRSGLVGGSPWRKRPAYSSQLSPRSTARRGSRKCRTERRSPLANNAPSAAPVCDSELEAARRTHACEAAACVKGRHVGAQRPYFCTLPSERCTPPSHFKLSRVVESNGTSSRSHRRP